MRALDTRTAVVHPAPHPSEERRAEARPMPDPSALRPLLVFVAAALPAGWVMLALPLVFDLPDVPFLLATNLLALFAPALFLTGRGPEGSRGVRRLLAGAIRLPRPKSSWLVVLAIPVVSYLVAAPLGAAAPLSGQVLADFTLELLAGALIINVWEEVAWTGFVQRRAMARWGILRGSAATAGLFAGIHLPLAFYDAATLQDVLLGVGLLVVTGLGLRLLLAGVDAWTSGSLLTVGLVHSSFNATRVVVAPDHDLLRLVVTLVLGLLVALVFARRAHGGRGRRRAVAVRTLAAVGLLTFSFMFVLVTLDALGRSGEVSRLEPAGSAAALLGAQHPGETVHLAGVLGGLVIGASGLIGLVVRPRSAGFATQTGGVALGAVTAVLVMGDPDNSGGQAGPVDLVFLVMALPVLAAAVAAAPWREWRHGGVARRPLLVLAALGLPAALFGLQQALLQRTTWPPLADPHHQSHWYVMAVLGLVAVPVVAGAALSGQGWRWATTTVGLAASAVAVASLVTPAAASAVHPGWAAFGLSWGLALLAVTWNPRSFTTRA